MLSIMHDYYFYYWVMYVSWTWLAKKERESLYLSTRLLAIVVMAVKLFIFLLSLAVVVDDVGHG